MHGVHLAGYEELLGAKHLTIRSTHHWHYVNTTGDAKLQRGL